MFYLQTRSPGAPVLIVGTHYDLFKRNKNSKECERELKQLRDHLDKKLVVTAPYHLLVLDVWLMIISGDLLGCIHKFY